MRGEEERIVPSTDHGPTHAILKNSELPKKLRRHKQRPCIKSKLVSGKHGPRTMIDLLPVMSLCGMQRAPLLLPSARIQKTKTNMSFVSCFFFGEASVPGDLAEPSDLEHCLERAGTVTA